MNTRRPEIAVSCRHPFSPYDVNKFASGSYDPLVFLGAGSKRDPALSRAVRDRRLEAADTANTLLRGGLRDVEVYAVDDSDTMLDLATRGSLRDNLGRQRRRWRGYADEAYKMGTQRGREYGAFCQEGGYDKVTQVVVRAPISVIALTDLRITHAQDSARLGERLRYGGKKFAPNLVCDLVSAEIRPVVRDGNEVDLHFHLAVRGSIEECRLMREYFERSGWAWWDALTGGSEECERYPGALAQYQSKSLAHSIRQANAAGVSFSATNLAELHRQTRRLALTRPVGAFRKWMGDLSQSGRMVIEDKDGRLSMPPRPRRSTLARLRDPLFTNSGARLLRLTLHDFGDGSMRPAARVRGREGISFSEIAATYDLAEAVVAARRALLKGNTAIPESSKTTGQLTEDRRFSWSRPLPLQPPEGLLRPSDGDRPGESLCGSVHSLQICVDLLFDSP